MTASVYQAVDVPSGSDWVAVGQPFALPATVTVALERARGALIRTVYRLQRQDATLVALGYHRPGTAQEKLTAVSGDAELLAELADRVGEQLAAAGAVSLKLELPADARAWHRAARDAGLVQLDAPVAAAPPASPDAIPAGFVRRLGGWSAAELPYYRQSTEFTCGPVAALTAASALGLAPTLDRSAELQFWRESTSAPGCDGYGLATALAARGVRARVVVNTTSALQVESAPAPWQVDLREFTQQGFRAELERLGIEVDIAEPSIGEALAQVERGRLALLLIDEAEMHGEACPHWVVLHGALPRIRLVNNYRQF